MHLAAQYLAAAGISFLEKKDDDSHTNLGFSIKDQCLYTHVLSTNEDVLGLDYKNFALVWSSKTGTTSLNLDGASHSTILQWLSNTAKSNLNKLYTYKFHYDLPYSIDAKYTFKLSDPDELKTLRDQRVLAEKVIQKIKEAFNLNTACRVWPHHFDTGIYAQMPNSEITIGLGLAIPDNVSDKFYFYISGYKDGKTMDTSGFSKLALGEWKSDGFTGAILELSNTTEVDGVSFFKEAISQLQTQ